MFRQASMLSIAAAMACTWAADAQAQTAPPPAAPPSAKKDTSTTVEQLVVTVRRRVEALQDVPVSAAVIEGDYIERMALKDPRDLIAQIPGVRMAANTVGASVADDIVIRGVGTARLDSSGSPTGIFRDNMFVGNGTYFGKSFTQFDMFDIKRFELFKGPQGALWGRQAAGGAVSIISNEPEPTFSARATSGYEVEQRAAKLEGVINVPLSDTVAIRLGGQYDHRDGGQVTIQDPASPLNGRALDKVLWEGIRGAILWQTTPDIRQKLTVEYYKADNPSYAVYFSRPGRGDPSPFTRACSAQLPTTSFIPGQFCQFNDPNQQSRSETAQAFYEGKWDIGQGTFQLSGIAMKRHTKVDDEWDTYTDALVGPTIGLSPTGALLFGAAISNRGVGPSNTSLYPRQGEFKKAGAELLYTSTQEGPFNWLAGVDYYDTTDVADQQNIIQYLNPTGQTGLLPNGALLANQFLSQTNERDEKSWSAFGSVQYDVMHNLTLSLEGRYTDNNTINTADNLVLISCPGAAPLPTNCAAGLALSRTEATLPPTTVKEGIFTPVATATYKFIPGQAVYLRYATGFRPAGYDSRSAGLVFFGPYGAEKVKTIEIGYKGTAFGDHFSYDLDTYDNHHTNFQIQDIFVGDDGLIRSKIGNAPKAESWGVEASGRSRFAAAGGIVTTGLSYAWTDGVIRPYMVPTSTPGVSVLSAFSNRRLSDTRDYQISLDAGYEAPLTGWSNTNWRVNVNYRLEGGGFQNPQNTLRLPTTKLLDATLGLTHGAWRATLYGHNLTNEIFPLQNIPGVFPQGATTIYNQPRTWGAEITRTW